MIPRLTRTGAQAGESWPEGHAHPELAHPELAHPELVHPDVDQPEAGQSGVDQSGARPAHVADPFAARDLFDIAAAPMSRQTATSTSRGAAPPAPLGAEGHRARLRARLLAAGPESLADHEMLEMLLFLALPRRDTKPIARAVLSRFGGFGAAITASPDELRAIDGLGEAGIAALKLARAAALRLLRGPLAEQPVLDRWNALTDYLRAALRHERTEQFRVLFLDARARLLADELMGLGTVDHAPVYPREIARRALERHASTVILVHNHPSGSATPSRDDIAMTREVARALQPLSIVLHDHLIVAGERCVSLREAGLVG